jgi:uncharacterized protein (DUF58 family)
VPTHDEPPAWAPTVAHFRSVAIAVVAVSVALVWRRPDLLVIGAPFVVVAAWSQLTRPVVAPTVDDGVGHPVVREGDATRWRATLSGTGDIDLAVAEVEHDAWIETRPPGGSVTADGRAVDGAGDLCLEVVTRSTRWGRRSIERAVVTAVSPWSAFRWTTVTGPYFLTTLPTPPVFDVGASPRPPDGLVGLHRSSRAGEGNEFAGIRPFRTGDRMRRINWRRSTRSDGLLVNATWADLDTHVALVIDATDDFGVSEGVDGRASSLDATVRAAGAIAEHYAPRGERVSLHTFGSMVLHTVPPGTGHTQLRRVLDTLATIRPAHDARHHRTPVTRRTGSTAGQLTVMLSPLIAPEALDLAVSLARQGVAVVVIDTLPEHVAVHDDEFTELAWRIRLLERRREVRKVTAGGIPVVSWRGPGSLDQVIRDIARRTSGPRMVRR